MDTQLLRESIVTLLTEIYEGPPDPRETWVVSNSAGSGILPTIDQLTAAQAQTRPHGLSHSVAEHVAHLRFSLETGLAYARGENPKPDWRQSWITGELDEDRWRELRQSLRESVGRMIEWVTSKESFAEFPNACGCIAASAHAAYHLGEIRQLAKLVAELA